MASSHPDADRFAEAVQARKRRETLTFVEWMDRVDAALERRLGLSSMDLPDICYRDLYDDGARPEQAAGKAIRYAKGGE